MLEWLEKIVTVEAHRVVYGTISEFFLLLVDRKSDPVFGKMGYVLTDMFPSVDCKRRSTLEYDSLDVVVKYAGCGCVCDDEACLKRLKTFVGMAFDSDRIGQPAT